MGESMVGLDWAPLENQTDTLRLWQPLLAMRARGMASPDVPGRTRKRTSFSGCILCISTAMVMVLEEACCVAVESCVERLCMAPTETESSDSDGTHQPTSSPDTDAQYLKALVDSSA